MQEQLRSIPTAQRDSTVHPRKFYLRGMPGTFVPEHVALLKSLYAHVRVPMPKMRETFRRGTTNDG